jgi:hypothetical protein
MKFNWGHGLFAVIVLGVSGILLLVYLSSKEKIDLVTDDYYPKELRYEEQIIRQKNTQNLSRKVSVTMERSLKLEFPDITAEASDIKGEIWLYRPSDKIHDRREVIRLDTIFRQEIELQNLPEGKYEVILEWNCNNTEYYQKEILYLSR